MATKPEVFIVESLKFRDEAEQLHEGEILSRMLNLMGKDETTYFYIRTRLELDDIIDKFEDSAARYLHLSCHANLNGMATTLEPISYEDLGAMLGPCLKGRRVFLSACQMANDRLAKSLFKGTGLTSLLGPAKKIDFDVSAAFWIAFYQRMFAVDHARMKHAEIESLVGDLERVFRTPFRYFRRDDHAVDGYRLIQSR